MHIYLTAKASCQSTRGVTLIELMLVMIIIGVLAALTFPTYQNYITQSRRSDGITQLLRLKIQQEAYRIENTSYASTQQLAMPASDYYHFSVLNESSNTYTLMAKAVGSQKKDSLCKVMSIDQSMKRTPPQCFR